LNGDDGIIVAQYAIHNDLMKKNKKNISMIREFNV
jgi:hypothetical protein